jgi:hypothetical protein
MILGKKSSILSAQVAHPVPRKARQKAGPRSCDGEVALAPQAFFLQ